jgi:hypothetical protein
LDAFQESELFELPNIRRRERARASERAACKAAFLSAAANKAAAAATTFSAFCGFHASQRAAHHH